ncbi:PREDICTED: HEAT repeat-containing protein 1 [Ceratosolen solmsi marchali]|uniref:HEAT repeat-containing protein 1 n=1 Tax=Ceratosolen solmsi marchali TaxID=326594 RepID=A0AAJ7E2M5_9HYME|nr:PREDICTED: HEAT repeat-containing protein 1 [Ceratosolen solmsi marchali]
MATSLAEQLKKLRTPQTTLLLQDKRKPSLLFDTKEVANLDRDTIYNIGVSGLEELIKLCKTFEDFKKTLFAQSSINLERSVQNEKVNAKLNIEIEKFLVLLSPYFLLNTAHKALEWLIHRFHIHQFNKDHYLLLILPYHESRMFIRALQLLDLSNLSDKWYWLKAVQKSRSPLPPLSLMNRVANDNGFLKLICNHVTFATNVYLDRANSLNTLYAFYATVLVGSIEHSSIITDVQFNHILPALLKGLSSQIPDFLASSYMIFAKLITKINLRDETMNRLVLKSIKKPVLTQELVLLILFLYDNPFNSLSAVSTNLMLKFSNRSWFVDTIIKVKNSGVQILKFIILLLDTAIKFIKQNSSGDDCRVKKMVNDIFTQIPLDENEVLLILKSTLINNIVSEEVDSNVKDYFIDLYRSVERKYPNCFDKYLHELMYVKESSSERSTILKFLTSLYSKADESLDIFTGLNHNNSEQRIIAIKMLSKTNITTSDNIREMINKSLLVRFNDDDDRVIEALLNLPINVLKNIFAVDTLVDELINLVSRCHAKHRKMLAKPALKLLLELCDESDETNVFLVAVPYLFPTKDTDVDITIQILTSDFAKRNSYFKTVADEIKDLRDAESVRSVAFHNILISKLLPSAANILSAIRQQMTHADVASVFFNMIILGSVCRVPVGSLEPEIARQAIEMAAEMVKSFPKVLPLNGATHINTNKLLDALKYVNQGHLPLQVNTYVLEMVHRRLTLNVNAKFDFEEDFERSQLVLRLMEIAFDGMILEQWRMNYHEWKLHYEWYLQIFFQRHFKNVEDTIRFLSQLFIKPVKSQTSLHCLQICLVLLDSCKSFQWIFNDNTFFVHLLLALSSENDACKEAAVNILKKLSETFNISMEGYSVLLFELVNRRTEILLDSKQLSLFLYTFLSPDPDVSCQIKSSLRPKFEKIRESLFEIITTNEVPIHVRSQLLELLMHVNGHKVLKQLIPLGYELLNKVNVEGKIFAQRLIKNILQRFDHSSVAALEDKTVWNFFIECISNSNTQIPTNNVKQYLSVILIKQIDNIFFSKLGNISKQLQKELLSKLVDIVTDSEINSIISVITRLVKKIYIDAQLIVDELKFMININDEAIELNRSKEPLKRKKSIIKINNQYNPELVNSKKWKKGITLLEFIQHSNNIENEELLVPVLFDLLKVSLCFEEQSSVEYTNQLVLSTIHHLATKFIPIKNADAYVDMIAQCIRTSHNPQTHHHALLVLVELFKIADIQRSLQNIMPIFTFMGNTVLRQDDAYSIQIISKTIETVVPIINATNNINHVCEILRLFITSLPDIPDHRRIPLFKKLLQFLDNHLHLYYLLTFESHVFSKNVESSQELSLERSHFALSILQEFSVQKIIQVCVKLVNFLRELPTEIEEGEKNVNFHGNHIFNVANCSGKQLRHYKFIIVRFLISLLSRSDFINRIAQLNEADIEILKPLYDTLIVELVMYIQNTLKNADIHQGKPNGKYWKVMLHGLYDVLDLINNLLPNNIFITSITKLINHEYLTVRRKALELLNTRIAQKKFTDEDYEDLILFIDPITKVLGGPHKCVNSEVEIIQQTALITLKLLAKLLASTHPNIFKPILDLATELVKKREGAVLSSAVLCVAELCSSMRIHAIQSLNKFMPAVIRLLDKHCRQEIPDILIISIVTALQKIVESIGNLLSLYLDQLLHELSRMSFLYTDFAHSKIGLVAVRLKAIIQKLSNCIPLRILLPAINKTYSTFLNNKYYQYIPSLMNVLAESFGSAQPIELNSLIPDLTTFFLKVLQFREDVIKSESEMEVDNEVTLLDITNVEGSASKTLVALVLKLSEATFRPLYYRLYDWAARNPQYKQRNITFYRLSANIAECLKSLFVLFAGHFLKHAASLLIGNNTFCNHEMSEITFEDEASRIELIDEILLTLYRVFTYDAHDFINQERFETLMQPLVDQVENTLGTKAEYERRSKDFIIPCIASFAGAIPDDSLHKQLVYQILLKTRHNKPCVRDTALNTLVEIVRKLGEDFMPLLPETVPFLAELLEDEDEVIEKNAQSAVRTLEEILGEPLQKYF